MLHLSHYYACYYALLFLLYQQQQQAASSLTVIIDGATTNEWATRDQYKRIVEQQQQHGYPRRASHNGNNNNNNNLQQTSSRLPGFLELPLALPQEQAPQQDDNNGNRQRTLEEAYQQQQQQQQPEAGNFQQQQAPDNDSPAAWLANAGSLEDLASLGDRISDEAGPASGPANELQLMGDNSQQLALASQPRIRGRESQLRKYCGDQLTDLLDLVCQGRYYNGQPEVVEPIIKSRRSSRSRALQGPPSKQLTAADSNGPAPADREEGGPLIDKPVAARNSRSRKVLYRRIRQNALLKGVTKECCDNPCRMEDLKPYYCELRG